MCFWNYYLMEVLEKMYITSSPVTSIGWQNSSQSPYICMTLNNSFKELPMHDKILHWESILWAINTFIWLCLQTSPMVKSNDIILNMENMQVLLSIKYQKSYQKEQNGLEKSNECTFKYWTGCPERPVLYWVSCINIEC